MNEWGELIKEYKIHRRQLKKQKDCLPADDPQHKIYSSMINEMTYAIDWMRQGHEPRIYSKAIYNKKLLDKGQEVRERPIHQYMDDENWIPKKEAAHYDVIEGVNDVEERQLSIDDMNLIQTFLTTLSEKQMECFVLNTSYNRSFGQIAVELGISKCTVQEHIELARKKVAQFRQQTERVAQ